jgi:hypothetical protein
MLPVDMTADCVAVVAPVSLLAGLQHCHDAACFRLLDHVSAVWTHSICCCQWPRSLQTMLTCQRVQSLLVPAQCEARC